MMFRSLIHFCKSYSILVLDEIDSLDSHNQEVLYTIFEWPSFPHSSLILLTISNSLDFTDRILPRLKNSVSFIPSLINFPPYSQLDITHIISNRLSEVEHNQIYYNISFITASILAIIILFPLHIFDHTQLKEQSAIDQSAIMFCARKVSSMAGDVRVALNVCRRAVEVVEVKVKRLLSAGGDPLLLCWLNCF